MSQLALAWTISKPGVTCVVMGPRNMSEFQENVQAASLFLPPEVITQLDVLTEPLLCKLGSNADYFIGTRTY